MSEKTDNHQQLNQWLSIGELAERSGVSIPTLRFYETKALIYSIRTQGNQRRYQRGMLRRVAIVKVAQQVGMSLQQVQDALSVLPLKSLPTQQDWREMSKKWQAQLDLHIMTLLKLRQQLDQCIGCGCLSLKQCPLRNPDDQFSKQSAGAHFQELLGQLLSQEIPEPKEIQND